VNVIAIDGPAGSGKSSTAHAVATRLGLAHLDSGALYRAVTLAALDHGTPLDGQRLVALARALPVRLALVGNEFRPEVAGTDVSESVRRPDVTARVSAVSALPPVRDLVNGLLRAAAAEHPQGVVVDGRDIGTVVFPEAPVKIFLTATPEARARRRLTQEGRVIDGQTLQAETERLAHRDTADAGRAVAPLQAARDAVVLDTTALSFDEQMTRIAEQARNVLGGGSGPVPTSSFRLT
jgi:cytidylate kinase